MLNTQDQIDDFVPNPNGNQIDSNGDALYRMTEENRINRTIFFVYLVISVLLSLGTLAYGSLRFPDSNAVKDNIVFINAPSMTIADSTEDPAFPYEVTVSGSIQNTNDIKIPSIFIDISFYDESNNLIGTYTLSKENVAAGEIWDFSEVLYADSLPATISYQSGFDETSFFYLLVNFLQVFITAMIFLVVDKMNFKKDWIRFKSSLGYHIGSIVIGYIMVFVALVVAQYILQALNVTTTSQNENTIAGMFNADPIQLLLLFLLLCVFTPIVEELVFRKAIYTFFQNKLGHVAGIIGSGLIFGLMHVIAYMDFIQSIPYIFMGLVFGYIYFQSKKNIYVTIGVHFINNFVSYLSYVVAVFGLSLSIF